MDFSTFHCIQMTDEGFQVAEYMAQIKQLRYNYTSFDLNEQSDSMKLNVATALKGQVFRFSHEDGCFAEKYDRNYKGQLRRRTILYPEICYELIQSYELAAQSCKDLRDPAGDR